MKNLNIYVIVSALIHGLAFLSILVVKKDLSTDLIHVTYLPQNLGSRVSKQIPLKRLVPDYNFNLSRLAVKSAEGPNASSNNNGTSSVLWAQTADMIFIKKIHQQIDSKFVMDPLLAQYNRFGSVTIEFEVLRDGTLSSAPLVAMAGDQVLVAHSKLAIRNALKRPIARSSWLGQNRTLRLVSRFIYAPAENQLNDFTSASLDRLKDPVPVGLKSKVEDGVLKFFRYTHQKPIAKNMAQHLLNGGINLDLFKMYDSWKKYFKHREREKTKNDPFNDYRKL